MNFYGEFESLGWREEGGGRGGGGGGGRWLEKRLGGFEWRRVFRVGDSLSVDDPGLHEEIVVGFMDECKKVGGGEMGERGGLFGGY